MNSIYSQCLEHNIYIPRVLDKHIIIYLKLGTGVFITRW